MLILNYGSSILKPHELMQSSEGIELRRVNDGRTYGTVNDCPCFHMGNFKVQTRESRSGIPEMLDIVL